MATGAWTEFTPVLGLGSGAPASAEASGRYYQIGTILYLSYDLTITTAGEDDSWISVTLPDGLTAAARQTIFGREKKSTGNVVQAIIEPGDTVFWIGNYDNTGPSADGREYVLTGVIEVN